MMMLRALVLLLIMAAATNGASASNAATGTTPCGTSAVCNNESQNGIGKEYCDLTTPEGECYECFSNPELPPTAAFCRGLGDVGVENCIQTCFPDWQCSKDNPCSEEGMWCDVYYTDGRGLCSPCQDHESPYDCDFQLEGSNFTEGKEACKETCFGPCSSNADCGDGFFCTFENGESGYCVNCGLITGEDFDYPTGARECLTGGLSIKRFEWTEAGGEACLSQCFEACTTSDDCPNDGFCNRVHDGNNKGNHGGAVCESCSAYPPYNVTTSNQNSDLCVAYVEDTKSKEDCAMICHGETLDAYTTEESGSATFASATLLFYLVGVVSTVSGFLVPLF